MDLSDALGDWPGSNQNNAGGWPGQPSNPVWPGPPSQPSAPAAGWPRGPSQPPPPTWPGPPSQPSAPAAGWPNGPSQPPPPTWPGPPSQPSAPAAGWPNGPSQPPPQTWPGAPSQPYQPTRPGTQENRTLPAYTRTISVQDGKLITILGIIKPNPTKFAIDFCAGDDILFHFNPRFNEGGRKVIVRNSKISKIWGKEERELRFFPFTPGKSFEIKILVTRKCFEVKVDNGHLLEYRHRSMNLRDITLLCIDHDVTVSDVKVEDKH